MEDRVDSESLSNQSSNSDDIDSESMKSANSLDFETVIKKFGSMKAIDLRKNNSALGNNVINPELYMQLYPLDDIFGRPKGFDFPSA